MRWRKGPRSDNIEDRRGAGGGTGFPGGFRVPMGGKRGGMGIGTILIILVVMWLFGGNLGSLFGPSGPAVETPQQTQQAPQSGGSNVAEDEMKQFVSAVLGSTEEVWHKIFQGIGRNYREPKLVLFTNYVRSACGMAQSAMGPFYCPRDGKVYIDLSFYRDMKRKLGAPGDFAQAYVIAHEVGHHVQNLFGIAKKVTNARMRVSKAQGNELSVRMELQADCFAGVWANNAQRMRNILEAGDIEEGLNAASAIGDDRLQKRQTGYVVPESFTHGTSAQRVRWFKRGLQAGDIKVCDTFQARQL
ncbi:MAG: KPN_02809 family neutral zinc metallopeptidase [Hyphomicrobiales bacterium]